MPDYCDNCHTMTFDFKEELRLEAIKWIKELRKEYDKINNLSNNPDIDGETYHECESRLDEITSQINWIEHFFGITDKDLK